MVVFFFFFFFFMARRGVTVLRHSLPSKERCRSATIEREARPPSARHAPPGPDERSTEKTARSYIYTKRATPAGPAPKIPHHFSAPERLFEIHAPDALAGGEIQGLRLPRAESGKSFAGEAGVPRGPSSKRSLAISSDYALA